MQSETGQTPLDRAISALADQQHGVIALWQLCEIGLDARGVSHRVAAGRLHRLYRGVFAVGHRVLRPEGHLMAAALACGAGACISHVDAAELHGIRRRGYVRTRIHVTSPTRAGRRYKRLRVHDGSGLAATDVTRVENIPCTAVPRTLLDLAETGPVRRAVERAEALGIFDLAAIDELLGRSNGRRGAQRLWQAVTDAQPTWTRSDIEDMVLTICENAGLPRPLVNVWIPELGIEVDFVWPDLRLIVEADGHESHGSRTAIERDHKRDRRLRALGWRVERFTWREIVHEPELVAAALSAAASAR
jgi:hypothetical protein